MAIELLKEDHQEIIRMIEELEVVDDESDEIAQAETGAFDELHYFLKLHTQIEEDIFYPALEKFDETRELVREAYRAHDRVDNFLAQLSLLLPDEEEFQEALSELRADIELHIEEEEGELFAKAEELCSPQKLEELGRQMEDIKNKARTFSVSMK
jgi:hemerythrin-like domain-containing protein